MSGVDPFGLPDDLDKTRIAPTTRTPLDQTEQVAIRNTPVTARHAARNHPNTLIVAFADVLEIAPELENVKGPSDVEGTRIRMLTELTRARDNAVASGHSLSVANEASWSVAALVDDLVLNTPWGATSQWPSKTLVAEMYGQVDAGTRFFAKLEELERNPARHPELLELMALCISFGFRGKYRVPDRSGARSLPDLQASLTKLIVSPDDAALPLSLRWQGADAPNEPARFPIPLWVIPVIAAMMVLIIYSVIAARMGGEAEKLAPLAAELPPAEQAEIVRLPRPDRGLPTPQPVFELLPIINEKVPASLVQTVKGTETVSLVTLTLRSTNPELFRSGRANLDNTFQPMVVGIADAISENSELIGSVHVIGHTDSIAVKSSNPFASNQRLSEARAQSIAELLWDYGVRDTEISSEGRAAREPVASNDTREGRAANRRVEIVVQKRI